MIQLHKNYMPAYGGYCSYSINVEVNPASEKVRYGSLLVLVGCKLLSAQVLNKT